MGDHVSADFAELRITRQQIECHRKVSAARARHSEPPLEDCSKERRASELGLGVHQDLPAGLTASVDVIGGKAENALLVPVEALRELGAGEYAVFVVNDDGSLEMRPVEVGLMDYSNAEIISGLELGEQVSTGTVEAK